MSISVPLDLWAPHVQTAVQKLNSLYPTTSIGTYPGHDPDRSLAADLMIPGYRTAAGKAFGWVVAKWIWANREELGVWYVIFDRKIISMTRPEKGWITYHPPTSAVSRNADSAYHYNHVHVSFYKRVVDKPKLPIYYVDPAKVSTTLTANAPAGKKDLQRKPGFVIDTADRIDGVWLVTKAGYRYHMDYLTTVRPADAPEATPPVVDQPAPSLPTYTVQRGDTLSSIASRINTTWQAIAALNPSIDPNRIAVGQVLVVPSVVPELAPAPKPDPKPEEATVTETIFGWNILRRTDDLPGRDRYSVRKPKIGKTLRDAKASVYLLIETDATSRKDCGAALGSNFTWWGYKYHGIYWDQRVWERVGDATNQAALGENRFLLSIPLRHKATGRVITFDVSHLENDGDATTDGHKARFSEMTKILARASKGNRVGFADVNSTTPGIIAKPTARQEQKPRYLLVRAGARLVTSLGAKVKNLAYGFHHGGKSGVEGPLIDEAWVMGDVQLVDAEIVRTDGTDASDHNAIKFRVKF